MASPSALELPSAWDRLVASAGWAEDGRLPVFDPSTGTELGRLAETSALELDAMLQLAADAQDHWAGRAPDERASALEDLASLLIVHRGELAFLEALDSGNPLASCERDVDLCARYVRHWSALARGLTTRNFPVGKGALAFEDLVPFGVAGAILAYNKPLLFAIKGCVPALLMGNGVLLKPAPQTSLVAVALRALVAGLLPSGLLQVAVGGTDVALAMAAHPDLRRLAFTGSAQAAVALQARAARAGVVKAFTWELGGINPFVVLPDMAPEVVARALVGAMSLTSTAGQSCQAMSRLLIPKASFASVLESVTERFAALRLGRAYRRGTEMGPLVSAQHRERVGDWVGRAQAEGAHPWAAPGHGRLPVGGYFMAPLVLAGLAPTSRLWATEVFGPVVAATPWEDEDELTTLLNLSCTGLAATVWGEDYARSLEIARRVRAGYVWVNSASEHVLGMPFGGTGDSGTGREEAQETLLSYSQSRSIVSRLVPGRSCLMAPSGLRDPEPSRVCSDLDQLSTLKDDQPGWTRRVFTEPDRAGREHIAALMRSVGLDTHIDAIGNVVGRWEGNGSAAGAVVTGSHTDTVLGGGRFDGVVGVIGAIEAVRVLRESGAVLRRDLIVVDFLGEEPNDFGISCIGSRALAGTLTPAHLALSDNHGRTMAEAVTRSGGDPAGALDLAWKSTDVHRYFELHIEQGPYLEQMSRPIGIVTGIVGIQRFRTRFTGRPDHAGTTAMPSRHDAGLAAAELMLAIESQARDGAVATTGIVELTPGATNVVPGGALLSSETRSIEPGWFPLFRDTTERRAVAIADRRRVSANVEWLSLEPPTPMDAVAMSDLFSACHQLGYEPLEMASYAGHDAVQMSHLGPCAMIFVPSRDGRSHCPEEWTDLDDLVAGARVLAKAIATATAT